MEKEKIHNLSLPGLYAYVNSSNKGLTNEEALCRLKKYGKNELPKKKIDSFFKIFIRQLFDPIVILLLIAAFFSWLIEEKMDAYAILFIIIVDLLMGTFQEWKSEKDAYALSKMVEVKTKVMRSGEMKEIDAKELVIGDVVFVESGNQICADLRVLDSTNLTVNESILTGESLSVVKRSCILEANTILAERCNMLYAGTSIVTGRGIAIVTGTGVATELGKIAKEVAYAKGEKSPLTLRMEKFSKQISVLVVIIAVIISILLWSRGVSSGEIFLSVIALSVSAMPEGLPLALTMALTIASNRMSKKKVIVKKLNAVESLGSCTVIASDKTGTLTVNEQTAKKIVLPNGDMFEIEGVGYNDVGSVKKSCNAHLKDACYIGKLGALNNEAKLYKKEDGFEKIGDSIDIAFLALAMKLQAQLSDAHIKKSLPYESEKKYSAVFYEEKGDLYCTAKGSLEKIIEFCTDMKIGDKYFPLDIDRIQEQNEELAREGYRVIALAEKQIVSSSKYDESEMQNMHFMGLVSFIDPIRKDAAHSILECMTSGIRVIMITGDHPLTAFAIAKELGIVDSMEEVATGIEIDEMLEQKESDFDSFIQKKKVYSRVTPTHKLKIVESYKRQNEFIAVTGDGVNDAPAIKSANIGIAMGSGTDVAKETASMIILDDQFSSIVSGIKEGRIAYSNIRKVSYMLLSCGIAEILFFMLSILFHLPMPLVAIQLLWLNIVTDGLQDLALSFEKAEPNIMKEKPRNPKESLFNFTLLKEVLLSGFTIGFLVFLVWIYLLKYVHMEVSLARGYIMVLMVFMQNMHVLNCRSETSSIFKIPFFQNPFIVFSILSAILLQIIVSEVPIFSELLQITSVPIYDMLLLFLLSTIIVLVMEIYKKIVFKKC